MKFNNLALGTVLTAPSPATSGTTLVLNSGEGARFPQPSSDGEFFITLFPAGENPDLSNAEIVRVTARSSDTFTIVRAQKGSSAMSVTTDWLAIQGIYGEDMLALFNAPQGTMLNGKIARTVTSNNITVAIKTLADADPTPSDPVYVRIGNNIRKITAALSVTKNAGTNWFDSGSTEHATQDIDYFVYLGYNSTDGVTIGFSRVPYGRVYGDFSATTTNNRYCAISNISNAVSTDEYELVARFNAILSATASFNWSIPATSIIINKPIRETRWLTWQPVYSGGASMTYSSVTTDIARYKILGETALISINAMGTTGGTANSNLQFTAPISPKFTGDFDTLDMALAEDGSFSARSVGFMFWSNASSTWTVRKSDSSNWGLGAGRGFYTSTTFGI